MMTTPRLCIVIPCYNEEQVLPVTEPMFTQKLVSLIEAGKVADDSRILFVNDGSKDKTWDLIREYATSNPYVTGISQSRNRGHQNAVYAGLMEARHEFDVTISIDCDGQDDIDAMDAMLDEYQQGADIVYGVREDRASDSFFKRTTAQGFYKILNQMGVESVYNHADYRLVSSRVLDEFSKFKEVNLFLRGMFPLVGFKSTSVFYKRHERLAGESKYPLSKMINLAIDGITSLSVKPIRVITLLGSCVAVLSFLAIVWTLTQYFMGHTVKGWASNLVLVLFVSGIQLISLGVIGEYIGKIYLEVKARPKYILSEHIGTFERQADKSETENSK